MQLKNVEEILNQARTMVDMERYLMGMGKYEFAKHLGIHYHTYNSFIKQDRITSPNTLMVIIEFLMSRGKDVSIFERLI